MKTTLYLIAALCLMAFASDKPAYLLYDKSAQKNVQYGDMLQKLKDADVVFFGEIHNSPICHWLQLQVTKDLYATRQQNLMLGAEMFEADNQLVLSEYVEGRISSAQLEAESKIWKNYQTDYKPLVDFARSNKLPFVATNVPRRYASMVSKGGLAALEQLSPEGKKHLPPLPIEVDLSLPGYKNMMDMGGMHGGSMGKMSEETMANMARAQAVKDATMAHFILKNWTKGKILIHYNGTYHSNNFEGIVWYLRKQNPDLKIVTIASTEEADIANPKEAKAGLADFILTVPADMTKTY